MTERIAEALPRPAARSTSVVYLVYFLTAIFAEILVGCKLVAYGNAINLIATGWYVILTLLFYAHVQASEQEPLFDRGALQPGGDKS